MNIPEIRMLRWMRWGYEMDKIRNKSIIEKLDKHMQDKVWKSHFRWLGHVSNAPARWGIWFNFKVKMKAKKNNMIKEKQKAMISHI